MIIIIESFATSHGSRNISLIRTYITERCSERAPHQPIDDRVDARVETVEDTQPAQQVDRIILDISDIEQDQGELDRHPTDREHAGDRQTGHYQSH